jgi:phytanoyl-CoA hydroxylase
MAVTEFDPAARARDSATPAAPDGRALAILTSVIRAGDDDAAAATTADAAASYGEHGYVVRRGVVDAESCARLLAAYRAEVKPARDFMAARPDVARDAPIYTPGGFVREAVANFHHEPPGRFPGFHDAGLAVLADAGLHAFVRALLGEEGLVVESLVYEGNPKTWPHQDEWYFDSRPPGRMVGCWIALEPIDPGAGRFFVVPGSHRLDMRAYGVPFDVSVDVKPYERLVVDVVRREGLAYHAPTLDAGDVVFWDGRTIHGTLETQNEDRSRASLNLHVVPASGGYQRFGRFPVDLEPRRVRGVLVHVPTPLGARVRDVARALLEKEGRPPRR